MYYYVTKVCTQQQKLYDIIKMHIFATQDKEKPDIRNARSSDLAAVKLTIVQVTTLPL
jgi:hypothetical protein